MSLEVEINKLNALTNELKKLNLQTIKKEDVLRLLDFLKDLIPVIIKSLKSR